MTTERDAEREQVEQVFGLTGGELADEPWGAERYWYGGVPSYAEGEHRKDGEYRTVVADLLLTCSGPDEMPADESDEDKRPWKRVASYASSGETECPGRRDDDGSLVRPEQAQALYDGGADVCPLCEAGIGEDHEYIYLGDGWAEVVYFRPEEPEPEE